MNKFIKTTAFVAACLVASSLAPLDAAGPVPGHPSWQMDTGG
jgi:hypothetical protein